MLIRPKVFLTCLALVLIPLLLLLGFTYWHVRRTARADYRRELELEIEKFANAVNHHLQEQENEFIQFAESERIREFIERQDERSSSATSSSELSLALAAFLTRRNHFSAVACFDRSRQQLFLAERSADEIVIREKDFLPGHLQPDERAWNSTSLIRSGVSLQALRSTLALTMPVTSNPGKPRAGVLAAELDLDSVFREAAQDWKSENTNRLTTESDTITVLDESGRILYHPNRVFVRQLVRAPGKEIVRTTIPNLNLVAVIERAPFPGSPRSLLAGAVLGLLLAGISAFLLARAWERRTSGMNRVTEGVAAIAGGDLNHRIEARSSDSIRPLSDNLNLMTAQLREQIARETEARQFQSFVRLSAMLTHDLKNAIEALSLIVSNMERHFDNQEFRADAMKSLNLATKNLRALVDRLSNPVTTLSGEYKRPQPVDVVSLLKRVISLTAEPAGDAVRIQTKLPVSLGALIDAERIEKVMENLILNGIEAMAATGGTLSVEAGPADPGQVYFSVSDTGSGMTRDFVENQLYRPFATTKKRGVGLGLYTCREVVRANGGTIEVDSKEGAGTTFRVVLPSASIERPD